MVHPFVKLFPMPLISVPKYWPNVMIMRDVREKLGMKSHHTVQQTSLVQSYYIHQHTYTLGESQCLQRKP